MSELSVESKKIREFGWRQGSLVKMDGSIASHTPPKIIISGIYILVSQTCDIQTPALSVEPYIEIILCVPIKKIDGNFSHGKNPRKLHIPFFKGNEEHYFECEMRNRFFVDRNKFTEIKPCLEYSVIQKNIDSIIDWIIKRYNRYAFPDQFNLRINRKVLRKIIENTHNDITHICIRLHTEEELPSSQPYKIQLYLLVDDGILESQHKKLITLLAGLVEEFERKGEIKVIDSAVLRLDQITVSEFTALRQLDFDFLSSLDN